MTTLVMLPGMDGTGDLFAPLLPYVEPNVGVAVVRYPTKVALNYAELEPLARAACPDDQPFVLVGESFSGPLAIQIAARPPAGLQGVILCATFATNPHPTLSPLQGLARFLPLQRAPAALLSTALLGTFATRELRQRLTNAVRSVDNHVLQRRLQMISQCDVRPELATVKVPILYLKASHDRLVPASAAKQIQTSNPSVQVASIQGPHCLLQANPESCAAKILEFVTQIS